MIDIKKTIAFFFKVLSCLLFTVVAGLIAVVQLFFKRFDNLMASFGASGFTICILTCICLSLFITITWLVIKDKEAVNRTGVTKDFLEVMVTDFKEKIEAGDYQDILHLGPPLSRLLWLSGDYDNRVKLGKLVQEAALYSQNKTAEMRSLIDDTGWTLFVLNKPEKAITNINKGITIATDLADYYYIAKGNRHLFNIYLQTNNMTLATSNLSDARTASNQIEDTKQKKEMTNGIDYDAIELFIKQNALDDALNEATRLLNEYKATGDKARTPKVYSLIGKIYFLRNRNDEEESIKYFKLGLNAAKQQKRKDEVIKCYMGLTVCYLRKGDTHQAQEFYDKCKDEIKTNPVVFLYWDCFVDKLININF